MLTYNHTFRIRLNGELYDYTGEITSKTNKTYWLYRCIAPEKPNNSYDNGGPITKLLRISPTNGKWKVFQYSGYAGVAVQSFSVNYADGSSVYIDGPALPYTYDQYAKGEVNWTWYRDTFDGANGVPVAFPFTYNGTHYFITHIVSIADTDSTTTLTGFNMDTGLPLVNDLVIPGTGTPNIRFEETWTLTNEQYLSGDDIWTD